MGGEGGEEEIMQIALVTTTINVPTVLALYCKYLESPAGIFVAGDLKTPVKAYDFCHKLGITILYPEDQKRWRSSDIIGWNTDSRRNFAILEALRWGADLIVSVDDDMIPYDDFFMSWRHLFEHSWSGLKLGAADCWFDHGMYTVPPARARGVPTSSGFSNPDFVENVTIGLAQGSILGTPDTDAETAMERHPHITGVSDILRQGFVTDLAAYSVFNSQLTAFRSALAPAAVQFYGEQKRNTDIFAAMLMRRFARELGWYTHYGLPLGYHNRSVRDLKMDWEAERWGVANISAFAEELAGWKSEGGKWDFVDDSKVLSDRTKEMYAAWAEDCEEAVNGNSRTA